MEMEIAWTGLSDENFSSFRAMLDEGDDGFYSTMDANGGTFEALLGSSLRSPEGSVLGNLGGSINTSEHLSCSMTTSTHTGDSDQLDLLHRRAGIVSGFHKNGVNQKPNSVVNERGANSAVAIDDTNNKYVNGGNTGRGKKNGLPAKNLMAERRRRKKLNDRLLMLRSVVPKISKMDRSSILADAVEYLQELLQSISDLHTELMSGPCNSKPLAPTLVDFPCRMNEEYQASFSNRVEPARVEVRKREGKALHINMFCSGNPGLLLSTVKALDGLGFDVQQAVISCLNGFALDVLQEKSMGEDVTGEEIKALLLPTAGYQTGL